jgi:flagellar basal-body rod protein FlgC
MSDFNSVMQTAASGMRAQTMRMRLSAENIANSGVTAETPGGDPYRRRVPIFQARELDGGGMGVKIKGAYEDQSQFRVQFNPSHPAADADGYIKLPNVDSLVEMMDLREASRAYEANLNMVDTARQLTSRTLELLRR